MSKVNNMAMMSDHRLLQIALDAELEMIEKVEAVGKGQVGGLIISGPPGVGKTFTTRKVLTNMPGLTHVEDVTSEQDLDKSSPTYKQWFETNRVVGNGPLLRKSTYSNWSLVRDLWRNRNPGNIIMIDDNDAALRDLTFCATIMSATEQEVDREVHYTLKMNKELECEHIKNKFAYEGGIIMLTNYDMLNPKKFDEPGHKTYHERWRALVSRLAGSYIDMNLEDRALIVFLEHKVRISKQITDSNYLQKSFGSRGVTEDEQTELFDFVRDMVQANALKQTLDLRVYNAIAGNVILAEGKAKVWKAKTLRDLGIKGVTVAY